MKIGESAEVSKRYNFNEDPHYERVDLEIDAKM